jgi:RNA polymerase sigma-70 factor (ECF subfamily)
MKPMPKAQPPRTEPTNRGSSADPLTESLARLTPRVKAWLFRLLGPGFDLDDALQDALFELARAIPRFDGRSRLETYAYRVVLRSASRHRHRARRVHEPLDLVPPPADLVDPESRAVSREALRRLYEVLDRLPEKRRRAFLLCRMEGLDPHEAAEIEEVSSEVMRSRLRHACADVAAQLARDPYLTKVFAR